MARSNATTASSSQFESNELEPDPRILAKLKQYRDANAEIMTVVGHTEAPLIRRYIEESDVGNLFADIFIDATGADVAFVHSGSLRKDLPEGDIRLVDILDTYPFVDEVTVKENERRTNSARTGAILNLRARSAATCRHGNDV